MRKNQQHNSQSAVATPTAARGLPQYSYKASRVAFVALLALLCLLCAFMAGDAVMVRPIAGPVAIATPFIAKGDKDAMRLQKGGDSQTSSSLEVGKKDSPAAAAAIEASMGMNIVSRAGSTSASSPALAAAADDKLDDAFGEKSPLCGAAVLAAVGLEVTVRRAAEAAAAGGTNSSTISSSSLAEAPATASFLVAASQPNRDLQLAGRAVARLGEGVGGDAEDGLLVLSPTVTRESPTHWRVTFGPCYYDDDANEAQSGGANPSKSRSNSNGDSSRPPLPLSFEFDVIATWLGSKFLGQRWRLPDRNDNPPFVQMRRKCLELGLSGAGCEQYGLTLAKSKGAVHSQAIIAAAAADGGAESASQGPTEEARAAIFPPLLLRCLPRLAAAPACYPPPSSDSATVSSSSPPTASPLFGNGQWRSVAIPPNMEPALQDATDGVAVAAPLLADSSSSGSGGNGRPRRSFEYLHEWAHLRAVLDDPVGLNHLRVAAAASNTNASSVVGGLVDSGRGGEGLARSHDLGPLSSGAERSLVMAWEPPCSPSPSPAFGGPITSSSTTESFANRSSGKAMLGALSGRDVAVALHRRFGPAKKRRARMAKHERKEGDESYTYTIALFGDSMMVEQFSAWCFLLHGAACERSSRQGKSHNLRWMNVERTYTLSAAESEAALRGKNEKGPEESDSSAAAMAKSAESVRVTLRVRFARSYTTKGGHSVIAAVGTIARQLLSVDPDVVAGNLASLHWQQNMRSQEQWEGNLRAFGDTLRRHLARRVKKSSTDGAAEEGPEERLFYYWGNTMIQMGRTQGLNSGRTAAFNEAARRILQQQEPLAEAAGGGGAIASSPSPPFVTYFDPLHLSVARRESSFDGQHWACYHRYGGVSATITQLWMAHLIGALR